MSLGSGSSGNCYYLCAGDNAILIDAGIGIRTVKKIFKEYSLSLDTVKAVFITHDHADHIKAAGHLGEKHGIPIYTTPEIHEGMKRSYCMTEKLSDEHKKFIHKGEWISLYDFSVTCFEVPHDGTDNVGYCIKIGDVCLSFLTDIGHITPIAAQYIACANYLILEANYDDTMLQMGPYPRHLKMRISSPYGHLSNNEMATFLSENYPPGLKHLWLCHLSKENNHPGLVSKVIEQAFKEIGITVGKDVIVEPLRRTMPSEMYTLE